MTTTLTSNAVLNLAYFLVVAIVVLVVAVVVLAALHHFAIVGQRRATAANIRLRERARRAEDRALRALTDPAPELPAAETQQLPRYSERHVPTYRPAAVAPPSTALVPRDAQLPVPVPPRDVVRAR